MGVRSRICGGHHEWTLVSVQLRGQEVTKPPFRDIFVSKCVSDEDGNFVV